MSENNFSLPSSEQYIDATFGQGGYLAKRFASYGVRSGQLALTRKVDTALESGVHLIAEAGTGTGKSLAYLIPATYRASAAARRIVAARTDPNVPEESEDWSSAQIVVVTANIVLQEQLLNKDLPLLKEILPWDFSYALLKGRNNYICLSEYAERRENGYTGTHTPEDLEQIESINAWVEECRAAGGYGDVSELNFTPSFNLWSQLSVGGDQCTGVKCLFREDCFSAKAFRSARSANIIVTNYHMLMAHLQVKQYTGGDYILPPFKTLICDEAHKLPDIARDSFGFKITFETIKRLARLLLRMGDQDLGSQLDYTGHAFFEALTAYRNSSSYKTRIKEPLEESTETYDPWKKLDQALEYAASAFHRQFVFNSDRSDQASVREAKKYERAEGRTSELRTQLRTLIQLTTSEENVYFIEDDRGKTVVQSRPIHVGPILKRELFDKHNVIATSATLCVGGEFDFIANEMGCAKYDSIIADSPFTWEDQALLIIPDDLPEPNDAQFAEYVGEMVSEVIKRAGGRTLCLFTSNRVLNAAYERNKNCGYTVLKQGDMPRGRLIKLFKEDVTSVLFGTESFWAGVDVPGEALSAVVIDRIPFPPPDDPIADAIAERDRAWFQNYSVPKAVIQIKQGFGRAIRATTDAAVVVILDKRLMTKRYGKTFLRSLPPVSLRSNMNAISSFLR